MSCAFSIKLALVLQILILDMKPDFSALIEQHERSLDHELAQMKKGPKRVAVGVRDHLASTDATVSLDLEVGGGKR